MSTKAEAAKIAKRPTVKQEIVDFSPERLRAPFFLRCGAVLIDYIIVAAIPVAGLLISRWSGEDGTRLINSDINNTGWLIAFLIGVSNIVLLPMIAGQSVGKIITGLRIVTKKGEYPSPNTVALRQVFGYLLTVATLGLGFFFSVFGRKGRALHDLLAGTVVIHARPQIHS
jgi:uncharacterized RDD family membrane protein YckC